MLREWPCLAVVGAVLFCNPAYPVAAGPLPAGTINQITDEGFNHGKVVEIAAHLSDEIGARLTNSPGMREAERWTQQRFRDFGLADVRAEPFDFGRGWSSDELTVRMVAPRRLSLNAVAITWTPGTNGPVLARVVVAPMKDDRDFVAWKGKLRGSIVLTSLPGPAVDETQGPFRRFSQDELNQLNRFAIPHYDPRSTDQGIKVDLFDARLDSFLADEGAVASIRMSRSDGRILHADADPEFYKVGQTPHLPAFELAAEDYRRIARLAKLGPVSLEINSSVQFYDEDRNAYNILADLPGRDTRAGYVMAGAHLDSLWASDGATDNAAGAAIVMEAARILSALRIKPRRGIRFALWSGEEQGLLGSLSYIDRHLAHRPTPKDPVRSRVGPFWWAADSFPITPLPGYEAMTAYFNVDNGSGRIRGIYAENNLEAMPIMQSWLEPLASLGATSVVAQPWRGTDHFFMSAIGLPAFQFVQDPLDYWSRTHHSNVDTFDHLRADDLRQAAVVLATVLLSAAESPQPLPRKPIPRQPGASDPFAHKDPRQ